MCGLEVEAGSTFSGFASCTAADEEEARFHAGRRPYPRPGHRRQYGDLQRARCGAVAAIAVPSTGAVGKALDALYRDRLAERPELGLRARVHGFSTVQSKLFRLGRDRIGFLQ